MNAIDPVDWQRIADMLARYCSPSTAVTWTHSG